MIRVICDTREPDPHPWEAYLPEGVELIREGMETGDFCLRAFPDGAVVERKTSQDLAGCLTAGRERFEREMRRARHLGAFCVVVEGDLSDLCLAARGMGMNSIVGTLAAWTRRGTPFVFAGGVQPAANFAFRFLLGQVRDIEKQVKAMGTELKS
jgi:ERCC4-type nuclease